VEKKGCSVMKKGCSVKKKGCSVKKKGCSVEKKGCSVKKKGCSVKKKADAVVEDGREYVCRHRVLGCDAVEIHRESVSTSIGVYTPEITNTNNIFSK
jgi:hypothetical protein